VTTALSAAGLDGSSFVFLGFAPARASERESWFAEVLGEDRLVVFFEAPHRMADAAARLAAAGERPIIVAKELTKVHEFIGPLTDLSGTGLSIDSGEFVVAVAPAGEELGTGRYSDGEISSVLNELHRVANKFQLPELSASTGASAMLGIKQHLVRRASKRHGILTKRRKEATES
jgi:16S rRNA (cytidine1402-2'-O)-methyltransferase